MIKQFHNGLNTIGKLNDIDLLPVTGLWSRIYYHRLKHRGKVDAVKFMKELNTVVERYALHQPIVPIPWTKSSISDGFPKILNPIKWRLRSSDPKQVMLTLSVFRTVESLRLPISKDISTVTAESTADTDLINSIIDFIPLWVKRIPPLKLKGMGYHFTLKNGPNGHALKESDKDIIAIYDDELLHDAIRTCQRIQRDRKPMTEDLFYLLDDKPIHSRLVQFPEKSGKTRTIAIIDYYSQRCLKPLHDGLMALLSKLKSDGTYSHQNVGKFAQEMTRQKSFIYCSDLTAFTDRFPAEIQRVLLFELLQNDELANALWTLLAKRTFYTSWSNEQVTYNCGQPMGAYSSWALCSLAHHLVVEYCSDILGIPNIKEKYRIIGDDNIITDERTAQMYQDVITRLGVNINLSKTVCSAESSENSGAEVAKQLYLNGTCLTPLTPGFINQIRKPYTFTMCAGTLRTRYEYFDDNFPSMLIKAFYGNNRRKFKLVWLLASNPITGIIKPEDSGYSDYSVWDADKTAEYRDRYCKIIIAKLVDQANNFIDQFFIDNVDLFDDDFDVLDFSSFNINDLVNKKMSGGGPWKDHTKPEPYCYKEVLSQIENQLTMTSVGLSQVTNPDLESLESLVSRFDFVPDPSLPYMDRKELRQKRITSAILDLYNYKEEITFVKLNW